MKDGHAADAYGPERDDPVAGGHSSAPAFRAVSVSKRFAGGLVLDGVSLDLWPSEVVAIVGPSGAGKSTLFRCLTRAIVPDEGTVALLGDDLRDLSEPAMRAKRRAIGVIFQQLNLVGRLSAIDNVLIGRLGEAPYWRVLIRHLSQSDRQIALATLDRVGLLDHAYQRADSLSGGQQQRVAIARALAQDARIILADEPVSSLDPGSADHVMEVLHRITRVDSIAVLCSLHQVDLAIRWAGRIVGLRAGRVVFTERAENVDSGMIAALYR